MLQGSQWEQFPLTYLCGHESVAALATRPREERCYGRSKLRVDRCRGDCFASPDRPLSVRLMFTMCQGPLARLSNDPPGCLTKSPAELFDLLARGTITEVGWVRGEFATGCLGQIREGQVPNGTSTIDHLPGLRFRGSSELSIATPATPSSCPERRSCVMRDRLHSKWPD